MDLSQLRKQAKDLKAAFLAGDPAARQRVLASHPNFAGRPAERLGGYRFVLRDAQATVAREQGFAGWTELLAASSPAHLATPAWARVSPLFTRAVEQARERGEGVTTNIHVVLALLRPTRPTVACEVLAAVGLAAERLPAPRPGGDGSVSSSIPLHALEEFARGLAVAAGRAEPTDEEVLLALVYQHDHGQSMLVELDVEPHEVYDELVARGVAVPALAPPPLPRLHGPNGPRVYVPETVRNAVVRKIMLHHPPGSRHWGTNASRWKPGMVWFDGEDDIDLAALARAAVDEPSLVEVVPLADAIAHEASSRRRGATP